MSELGEYEMVKARDLIGQLADIIQCEPGDIIDSLSGSELSEEEAGEIRELFGF